MRMCWLQSSETFGDGPSTVGYNTLLWALAARIGHSEFMNVEVEDFVLAEQLEKTCDSGYYEEEC